MVRVAAVCVVNDRLKVQMRTLLTLLAHNEESRKKTNKHTYTERKQLHDDEIMAE